MYSGFCCWINTCVTLSPISSSLIQSLVYLPDFAFFNVSCQLFHKLFPFHPVDNGPPVFSTVAKECLAVQAERHTCNRKHTIVTVWTAASFPVQWGRNRYRGDDEKDQHAVREGAGRLRSKTDDFLAKWKSSWCLAGNCGKCFQPTKCCDSQNKTGSDQYCYPARVSNVHSSTNSVKDTCVWFNSRGPTGNHEICTVPTRWTVWVTDGPHVHTPTWPPPCNGRPGFIKGWMTLNTERKFWRSWAGLWLVNSGELTNPLWVWEHLLSCKTLKHHSVITVINGDDGVLMSTLEGATSLSSQLADNYDRPQYYHNDSSTSRV